MRDGNVSFVVASKWYSSLTLHFSVLPKYVHWNKQIFLWLLGRGNEKYCEHMHSHLFPWPTLGVLTMTPAAGVSGHPTHVKTYMSHSLPAHLFSGWPSARISHWYLEPGSRWRSPGCYGRDAGREPTLSSSITGASQWSHMLQEIRGPHLQIF